MTLPLSLWGFPFRSAARIRQSADFWESSVSIRISSISLQESSSKIPLLINNTLSSGFSSTGFHIPLSHGSHPVPDNSRPFSPPCSKAYPVWIFTVFIGLRRQNIQRLPLAQRNHLPAPHDCDTDISCHRIIQVAAIYKHCAGAGTASALSYRSLDTLVCLQKRCPEKYTGSFSSQYGS